MIQASGAGFDPALYAQFLKYCRKRTKNVRYNIEEPFDFSLLEGKGFVVVSNYTSSLDPFAVCSLVPRPLNVVVPGAMFGKTSFPGNVCALGIIEKNVSSNDYAAAHRMYKTVREGGGLLLFPEGRIGLTGEAMSDRFYISRFLKILGVPVLAIRFDGAYFAHPAWRRRDLGHKVPVHVTVRLLFDESQLKSYSCGEMDEELKQAIYYNDYEWQKREGVLYHGRNLIDGLENLIYMCPRCNGELCFSTKRKELVCQSCGNSARLGPDMRFCGAEVTDDYFGTIALWHRYQQQVEYRRVLMQAGYSLTVPASWSVVAVGGARYGATGEITVQQYGITLQANKVTYRFAAKEVPLVRCKPGVYVEFYREGETWRVYPKDGRTCVKIAVMMEQFLRLQREKADKISF